MPSLYQKLQFEKRTCIPARLCLYMLCVTGMGIMGMLRGSASFTLLAMDYGGTFDWSIDVQYYYLTCFFWAYILMQLIGGAIVQRYRTKAVFGIGILASAICSLLIPYASITHYIFGITLQFLQGIGLGVTWTSIYAIVSVWVPIQERSRFITCFQGMLLGNTCVQVTSGYIIIHIGWEYVYYFSGILGLVWCFAWFTLVHNTPEQHPRISPLELKFIQENRGNSKRNSKNIPWKRILKSAPVWSITISCFGRMWMSSIIIIYGPLYLKDVIGFDAKMNGLLFGASSICTYFATFVFSFTADKMISIKKIPMSWNRKLFTGIGHVFPAIFMFTLYYLNCNIILIAVIWCLAQVFVIAQFSGAMVNIVDVSPSFSGPVSGMVQVVSMTPMIFATLIAKVILKSTVSDV
ncbi:hypothetical protein FQR65_LT05449 [Abscondita terminalis]|nr:hypothetical protein FQR65_LT05449 [Abscondita terminalis]